MAENFYRTETFDKEHTHFGGIIYPYDFETEYYNGRNIANRIASDWRFDAQCKKNEIARENQRKDKKNV